MSIDEYPFLGDTINHFFPDTSSTYYPRRGVLEGVGYVNAPCNILIAFDNQPFFSGFERQGEIIDLSPGDSIYNQFYNVSNYPKCSDIFYEAITIDIGCNPFGSVEFIDIFGFTYDSIYVYQVGGGFQSDWDSLALGDYTYVVLDALADTIYSSEFSINVAPTFEFIDAYTTVQNSTADPANGFICINYINSDSSVPLEDYSIQWSNGEEGPA